jgi:hypothetical protein
VLRRAISAPGVQLQRSGDVPELAVDPGALAHDDGTRQLHHVTGHPAVHRQFSAYHVDRSCQFRAGGEVRLGVPHR